MENRQLLMIEDEEEICQQVADYFAADDGITLMDTVQDGCVSQEQLIKADVLVLDLIVPQQDGISVLEQVVQMPPQLRPEVIITSWFASKEIIQHTLSLGAKFDGQPKEKGIGNCRRKAGAPAQPEHCAHSSGEILG